MKRPMTVYDLKDKGVPFVCVNCGNRPTLDEVISGDGVCLLCQDEIIAYTVDTAILLKKLITKAEPVLEVVSCTACGGSGRRMYLGNNEPCARCGGKGSQIEEVKPGPAEPVVEYVYYNLHNGYTRPDTLPEGCEYKLPSGWYKETDAPSSWGAIARRWPRPKVEVKEGPAKPEIEYVYWHPGDQTPTTMPEHCESLTDNGWKKSRAELHEWRIYPKRWPKPIVTCKWKHVDRMYYTNPHNQVLTKLTDLNYCCVCGKPVEIV